MRNIKIVIVGHVDHGKSTLIGRLLYDTNSLPDGKIEEIKKTCKNLNRELEFAYLMDSLQEEVEQEFTMDTTQVFFRTAKGKYTIIDTPGHNEFIKNMITGASQADVAILVVDAKDNIKEQTKRHAYVLTMLGLKQLIVVINKMDLVDYEKERFNLVKKNLLDFLNPLGLKISCVIPIVAKKGDNIVNLSDNMKWYNGKTLLQNLDDIFVKEQLISKKLRFSVQDIYNTDNKKIMVGRVESGELNIGDDVIVMPDKVNTKIKTIEVFLDNKTKAMKNECIGITLDNYIVERGSIICGKNDLINLTNKFLANIFWMSEHKLKINDKITLKLATQKVDCIIEKIKHKINSSSLEIIKENVKELDNLEVGEVIVKTFNPVVIERFIDIPELGRFVLIRDSEICAGGIIIDI